MLKYSGKPNRQVKRTKSWIFDALMLLMDAKPYNSITVSDITEKAGVSRQTFYYYYKDKTDIIVEHLINTFNMELINIEKTNKDEMQKTIIFLLENKKIIKHQKIFKKILSVVDIENRIFHEMHKFPMTFIEHYKKNFMAEEYLICRYKLYFQITGCLSRLLKKYTKPYFFDKLFSEG
jgi:AcrR family transcriptional regulator